MEAWALILWLWMDRAGSLVSQTFQTKELCEAAGDAVLSSSRSRNYPDRSFIQNGNYVCVPRSAIHTAPVLTGKP